MTFLPSRASAPELATSGPSFMCISNILMAVLNIADDAKSFFCSCGKLTVLADACTVIRSAAAVDSLHAVLQFLRDENAGRVKFKVYRANDHDGGDGR